MRPCFTASSHNIPELPLDRVSIVRARVCVWVHTDDATSKPMQFWNEIYCTCTRDNIYQARYSVGGLGPGNEARYSTCVIQAADTGLF